MKKILIYLTLGLLISCGNSITTEKFTIIKEDKNEKLKKITIDVRLDKEINKAELKKIGLKIKEDRKFWERHRRLPKK
jgi:hypothetical protein